MSQEPRSNNKPGWQKALWFVGLWLAGVLTLAVIGYGIRLFLA
ncbi:DUF2474 family protein [Kangiella aquimarina]|uniref:DUF2474 family protein n=1 Tax=Kangiella aquimarina TaxID=261965 RepID=A0ABZ0X785_9GAMM|nr:DUF2474 family protein [Kangiella aquimarina]WQG86467.1 DUF2474 family protein [Kangiella aquimarina]